MGTGNMRSSAWQRKFSDAQMRKAILDGFKRTTDGKKQKMKPMKGKLSSSAVEGLIAYVRLMALK